MPSTVQIPHPKKNVIVIVGNIGSGKSTLTKGLSQILTDSEPLFEPVDDWTRTGILDAFYKNPKKLSFAFQMYAFSSRLKYFSQALSNPNGAGTIVMDGHVCTDRHVFKEVLKEDGSISAEEDMIYENTFKNWGTLVPEYELLGFIYLKTDPKICLQRAQERARTEEVGLPIEYLEKLDRYFDKLYERLISEGKKIIKVDGNQLVESVASECFTIMQCRSLWSKEVEVVS